MKLKVTLLPEDEEGGGEQWAYHNSRKEKSERLGLHFEVPPIIYVTQITEKPAVDKTELAIRSEIQLLIARATKNKRCLFGYL